MLDLLVNTALLGGFLFALMIVVILLLVIAVFVNAYRRNRRLKKSFKKFVATIVDDMRPQPKV